MQPLKSSRQKNMGASLKEVCGSAGEAHWVVVKVNTQSYCGTLPLLRMFEKAWPLSKPLKDILRTWTSGFHLSHVQ